MSKQKKRSRPDDDPRRNHMDGCAQRGWATLPIMVSLHIELTQSESFYK